MSRRRRLVLVHDMTWLQQHRISYSPYAAGPWLHFTNPFAADPWLHFDTDSPGAANGRGLSPARVHDRPGRMLASVTQESLMAHADNPKLRS